MAINDPKRKLISITVKEVDPELLYHQRAKLCEVMRLTDLKLSRRQRSALWGIKNLLIGMLPENEVPTSNRKKRVKTTKDMVNRAKDLLEAGYSVDGIADKLGCGNTTVNRIRNGLFDDKFEYEASEFKMVTIGQVKDISV